MTENGAEPGRGGCPVWMKAVLLVSLFLNVAVVGLYVGHGMTEKDRSRGANREIAWILKMVPEHRHADTKESFDARRDALRSANAERRRYLVLILDTIQKEPFVREDLEVVLRKHRETSSVRREIVHTQLVEVLAGFTADERAVFAQNLDVQIKRLMQRQAVRE